MALLEPIDGREIRSDESCAAMGDGDVHGRNVREKTDQISGRIFRYGDKFTGVSNGVMFLAPHRDVRVGAQNFRDHVVGHENGWRRYGRCVVRGDEDGYLQPGADIL